VEKRSGREIRAGGGSGASKAKSAKKVRSDCIIPPRVADEVLNRFTLGRNEKEATRISEYVEWQCAKDDEKVTYLEKVLTEHILGVRHDCWNVRTVNEYTQGPTASRTVTSRKRLPETRGSGD
jgi:hypothetical protein